MNVGNSGDRALHVQLKYCGDAYDYYMPAFDCDSTEFAGLVGTAHMTQEQIEKW